MTIRVFVVVYKTIYNLGIYSNPNLDTRTARYSLAPAMQMSWYPGMFFSHRFSHSEMYLCRSIVIPICL